MESISIKLRLTRLPVDHVGPLYVPRNRLDAGLVRAHPLEEGMIRLQIQHARALPIVQRVGERLLLLVQLVPDVQVQVVPVGATDHHVRVVVVDDDVLLGGAVLRDDLHVGFVVRIRVVVVVVGCVLIVHVADDVTIPGDDPLVRIPVWIVGVDEEVVLPIVDRRRRMEQVGVDVLVHRLTAAAIGQTGPGDDPVLEVMVPSQTVVVVVRNFQIQRKRRIASAFLHLQKKRGENLKEIQVKRLLKIVM